MNAFFCVTFLLVLQLGSENAEDNFTPPPLLFFPVRSGKITFSIHKHECFSKNLDSCNQKSNTTTTKTPPTTLWKKWRAVGEKSYSSCPAFRMCFRMWLQANDLISPVLDLYGLSKYLLLYGYTATDILIAAALFCYSLDKTIIIST